jgi:hypothetical protein
MASNMVQRANQTGLGYIWLRLVAVSCCGSRFTMSISCDPDPCLLAGLFYSQTSGFEVSVIKLDNGITSAASASSDHSGPARCLALVPPSTYHGLYLAHVRVKICQSWQA